MQKSLSRTITLLLFIGLSQFLSACSQTVRSNVYQHPQYQATQQQHQHTQQRQKHVHTRQQAKKYNKQAVNQRQPSPRHTSQHSRSSQIVRPQYSPVPNPNINQNPARNAMVRLANSTIGAPYRWGGNNPQQGFDCSGLMSYVYKNAVGINIPRTAAKQRDASRTIDYHQLQPGDMLFFKTGKRSNHVGIYVGNRKFVHAATGSKHVKVASMDSSYWHKRFVKFGSFL